MKSYYEQILKIKYMYFIIALSGKLCVKKIYCDYQLITSRHLKPLQKLQALKLTSTVITGTEITGI